jgi:putative tryptophan/tyrosine transport system substrate-binding protein
MLRRLIWLLVTLTLALVLAPLVSKAQQPAKVPLLGILNSGAPLSEAPRQPAPFWQALRELGWIEGQNIAVERRFAAGQPHQLPGLAAELVRLRPDVIVTGGTSGIQAAQQATTTIPIVSQGAGMLVEQGIVASLAQPGGNITGVENNAVGLSGKRLEFLKAAVPQIARVAFLFNPTNPFFTLELPSLETDARALGLQLQPVAVRHGDEVDNALATLVDPLPDALFIGDDGRLNAHLRPILAFATTHRLPTMGTRRESAEAGSLLAFGYNRRELAQRAAVYVDKILKGAKPGDLPIERPTTFDLVINLKTAQTLSLTISPALLFQATEVIR